MTVDAPRRDFGIVAMLGQIVAMLSHIVWTHWYSPSTLKYELMTNQTTEAATKLPTRVAKELPSQSLRVTAPLRQSGGFGPQEPFAYTAM